MNGTQTSRTIGGTAYTFTFDYENRITEVKQGTTSIATFVYDADGNRVMGTVSGTTTVYIAGVYEYQGGATTKYYEGNAMRRTSHASGNGVQYLLRDHLGSSSVIVNQDGTVAKSEFYYPYGGNRGTAFSTLTTKRFTGQYHESGLPGGEGLSYYNARWYDAQLGRFVSADTIVPNPGNPQDLNRMTYVRNNPLDLIDPDGHDPWWLQDGPWNTSPQQLLLPEYAGQAQDTLTARQQQRVANYYRPPAPTLSQVATTTGARIAVEMVDYTPVFNDNGQIDWERTIGSTFGKALKACAIAADGVCGISLGRHDDFAGAGWRGSIDIFVDQEGDWDVLGTGGGGGYLPALAIASGGLILAQSEFSNLSVVAITNGSTTDMKGLSGQFGGAASFGQGVSTEWVYGRNSSGGYWHGVVVGASTGVFAELHLTATYSVSGQQFLSELASKMYSR